MNKPYILRAPRTRFPGLVLAAGLHLALLAVIWNYQPRMTPPSAGAPIMVSFITTEAEVAQPVVMKIEPVKPKITPKPKPEKQVLAVTSTAPAAFETAPPPEPPPPAAAPKGDPSPVITEAYEDPSHLQNKLRYPESMRRARKNAFLKLRVLITAQGTVAAVELLSSSGYPEFDNAALEDVKNWKYRPATRDGKPVESWKEQPLDYSIIKYKSRG